MFTAAASYLDARAHGGRWLVRMEDVDRPREIEGSAARILATLEAFGFEWDGPVLKQSERGAHYAQALAALKAEGLTFECSCSRQDLAEEGRYPGYCRRGPRNPGRATAVRLRVDPGTIGFTDRIQGPYAQEVSRTSGDLIVRRRDGLFAYLLAVVVDDAAQGVTHVVRGADLLDNTPRQIHLQRLLGLRTPIYAHVPALTEPDGSKLAKSARSVPADPTAAPLELRRVLALLGIEPPAGIARVADLWSWAHANFRLERVPRGEILPLGGQIGR